MIIQSRDKPDPRKTPFLAVEALVKKLAEDGLGVDQVRVVQGFLCDDAMLNEVMLYTVSRAWSRFHSEGSPLVAWSVWENAWSTRENNDNANAFLSELLRQIEERAPEVQKLILGEAAAFLQTKLDDDE